VQQDQRRITRSVFSIPLRHEMAPGGPAGVAMGVRGGTLGSQFGRYGLGKWPRRGRARRLYCPAGQGGGPDSQVFALVFAMRVTSHVRLAE
jgi:hypothetical protein